jgi:polyisoprenyl-phosphate glycosyltransferase
MIATTSAGSDDILLSVVVPCYNEEEVIEETHRRLLAACREAGGGRFEIVYVDDGSRDRTRALIRELASRDAEVVGVVLSRNFGHQLALSAGLSVCRGRRVLMIDADLQDPPELLGQMMALMDAGADVVYGQRSEREGETAFKRGTAAVFYRVLNRLSDVEIPADAGDFRLIDRRVLDALLAMPEQHRFVRGLIAWLGFNQVALPYVRKARFAGETKYPLVRMLRLAYDAITGFSLKPLRLAGWMAVLSLIAAGAMLLYVLYAWIMDEVVRGWASLAALVLFFSAAQMLCIAIIGEYVGRAYSEAKRRPLFVIDEIVSGDARAASRP